MSSTRTLDVSHLAPGAFGYRSILWWGTLGIVVIEAMAFALTVGAYFFLRTRVTTWPPNVPPPDHLWGAVNTIVLVASAIPNELARRAGDRVDLPRVRIWLIVCLIFGVAFNVVRVLEFGALNCRCFAPQHPGTLHGVSIAALVSIALAAFPSWQLARSDNATRVQFMARLGLLTCALFAAVVIANWVPVFIINNCEA